MRLPDLFLAAATLAPAVLTALAALAVLPARQPAAVWPRFSVLSVLALGAAIGALVAAAVGAQPVAATGGDPLRFAGLAVSPVGQWLAVLVQGLGTVIGVFSARYLQGEPGQSRYAVALAVVLAAVQVLLLADHWVVLIAAWAVVGLALERMLCFYADRPFARLAAHKKRVADRLADLLLVAAAGLAMAQTGSGSISDTLAHASANGASLALELAAIALVLAVIVRTALLPVHGWLIQVMEAPTPVSALLHAGVVNLGGFVLIRFAPLLEATNVARWLLVAFGLVSAVLAGFVMLTRVSIKVRLAWSTVAQMGFMLMECGLGLYELAVLHLIGHSLYKAHAFLGASNVVRDTRLQALHANAGATVGSVVVAPMLALGAVLLVLWATGAADAWPWWWSVVLALAWAPAFWLPSQGGQSAAPSGTALVRLAAGFAIAAGLTLAAVLVHSVDLGVDSAPYHAGGLLALAGMALMYLGLARLQAGRGGWATWRRWSYAGFYVDEIFTRAALRVWPTGWGAGSRPSVGVGETHATSSVN